MLGGFSLGIIVAAGVYVYGQLPPPGAPPATTQSMPAVPAASAAVIPAPAADSSPIAAEPVAAGTAQTGVETTEFEFYDVLPEFEVVVPETAETRGRDIRDEALQRSGNFIVQAGSFSTLVDADRRQAEIALLGIESTIQRVAIDDDVYHRVRIGPVTELAELNRVRRQLRDKRIEYLLINERD